MSVENTYVYVILFPKKTNHGKILILLLKAKDESTPKIFSINPLSGPPGTLVNLTGDFKTICYTRDVDECSDDSGSRITRIYFGGQICNLYDSNTNKV